MQERLRHLVVGCDRLGPVQHVAGIDVGFHGPGADARARAAVVVLRLGDLAVVESRVAERRVRFPYVPGLLSFRELPVILDALAKLERVPDLYLCDGQGLAHPRRFGLACHLGVILDAPAIGVAKSRLIGRHVEPGQGRGDWAPLTHQGEVIGAALHTRPHTRPVYVSTGHRVSLKTAIQYVMRLAPRYRLPETTRQSDRLSHPPKAGKGSEKGPAATVGHGPIAWFFRPISDPAGINKNSTPYRLHWCPGEAGYEERTQ